ncbi:MAG: hypothetical protein KKD28_13670, partial [Chloroflexi bacterium]|nr:hypothetical protein [Chloroflexota bacterium]
MSFLVRFRSTWIDAAVTYNHLFTLLTPAASILNSLAAFQIFRFFIKNMAENIQWLYEDVQENKRALEDNDSQLARRNYLRSLFAFYEISLSNLREVAAKLLVDDFDLAGKWDLHEIFPLLDETAKLGKNGKLDLEP